MVTDKTALINGISGQDAAYLSQYILSKGYQVIGVANLKHSNKYFGLDYLNIRNKVEIIQGDMSDPAQCHFILKKFRIDEFYNLAAQSSVSFSFEQPAGTIQYNILSVLHILETIRKINPELKFYQASSSEMYGKVDHLPITNETSVHPVSPYGISKATGHWLVSQYREAYDLYAVSGVLFNHESYLRPESFFVKKVIKSALMIKHGKLDHLLVGNIDFKRDFGYAKEYVKGIWLMLQLDKPEDLHVCSGKSVSLREIIHYVFDHFKIDQNLVVQDKSLFRPAEIEDIYGNNTQIKSKGWSYDLSFFEVLDILMDEEERNFKLS